MKLLLTSLFFVSSFYAYALEIDEKLTLRILEISSTKKTILINRGLEDGLAVDDHAKFFLTTGVVARGVVVKASPSRSVWSVYRIIQPETIEKNTVMNLKISSPVKLTEDPSKSLVAVQTPAGIDRIKVETAGGDSEIEELSDSDKSEISALTGNSSSEEMAPVRSSTTGSFEVWGLFNISSLSGSYDDGSTQTETSQSSLDFSVGAEKFFPTSSSFFKNLSVFGILTKRNSSSGSELKTTVDALEYGLGANYYFYNTPFKRYTPSFFATFSAGLGSVSYTVEADPDSAVPSSLNKELSGSSTFYSVGVGGRYMFKKLSLIGVLDYFSSSSGFDTDAGDTTVLNVSGPRFKVGMAYRW